MQQEEDCIYFHDQFDTQNYLILPHISPEYDFCVVTVHSAF